MEDESDGCTAGSLAVDFVLDVLSEALGDPQWTICDGSETWDGDVAGSVYSLLHAAGVIDEDSGETAMQRAATLRAERDALLARAEAAEAERDAARASLQRAAARFREYERGHREKGAMDKAARNQMMAEDCEAAIRAHLAGEARDE
jgi:hypothetical protein